MRNYVIRAARETAGSAMFAFLAIGTLTWGTTLSASTSLAPIVIGIAAAATILVVGCDLTPGVTIIRAMTGEIGIADAISGIAAQIAGSFAGVYVASTVPPTGSKTTLTSWLTTVSVGWGNASPSSTTLSTASASVSLANAIIVGLVTTAVALASVVLTRGQGGLTVGWIIASVLSTPLIGLMAVPSYALASATLCATSGMGTTTLKQAWLPWAVTIVAAMIMVLIRPEAPADPAITTHDKENARDDAR